MKRFPLFLNIFLALALLISHFAAQVNPNAFWPISFAGIFFPYLAVANLALVLFWMVVRFKYVILPLIVLAISWNSLSSVFAFTSNPKNPDSIKIMTYNVKNFDLYNWSKNKETRDKMLDLIERENPDILCIQEFFWHPRVENDNLKELQKRLSQPYYYYEEFQYWKEHHWGSAIFSKYPITAKEQLPVEGSGNNISIYSDLDIDGRTVRIYNLHMQSIFLAEDDYNYLKDISDMKNPNPLSMFKIVDKMKIAFKKRANQAVQISQLIRAYEGSKIVCGDFNDTPVSFTYQTIAEGMQDAFLAAGMGMGKTFVSSIPSFRIDYVLMDKSFRINSYRTVRENLSDHYPVIVEFTLPHE